MIKIEKHGYFFRKGRLRTECNCGCVYLTPKKKVYIGIEHFTLKEIFETTCPECLTLNTQYIRSMTLPKEEE